MEQVDWDLLHAAIMQRVQRGDRSKTRRWFSPIEGIFSFARIRPGYVLAVGCAVLILAIILLVKTPEPDQESMIPRETVRAPSHQAEDQEIGRYFRKSRALLVGLSNLDPPPDAPLDLSVERKLSRQLIIDGRSLREQNLDPRSSRLIGDLDRIMERVSSTTETVDPPDIHTIRSDIRGQNLLVKLRVAEASYSIIPVTKAREGL